MFDAGFERIGLVALAALMAVMVSCTAKPFKIVTDEDNGKTVEIPAGELLAVKLKAQLGTGYSWTVVSENKGLVAKNGPTTERGSGEMVAGGVDFQVFTFKANAAGQESIVLQYKRPWEKDEKPEKEYTITVSVK